MSLKNYTIELIEPDLSGFKAHEKQIRALLPTRKEHKVSFDLLDVDVSVANAVRRTVIEELEIKALTFDPTTIQTNVDYILFGEFLDRIQYIPIKQDIPDDLIMSIDASNGSIDNGIMTLYSDSIKGGEKYIPGRFRIAELRPVLSQGTENYCTTRIWKGVLCFSLSADYTYQNLDFMDVCMINNKGNRIDKRVRTDAVASWLVKTCRCMGKRVLVIPNPAYKKIMSEQIREQIAIAKYDITIESDKAYPTDDEYLEEQSSSVAVSREFRISFRLFDQIKPEDFLAIAFRSLIDRLTSVKIGLEKIYGIEGGGKKKTETEQEPELGHDTTGKVELRIRPVMVRHGDESISLDLWNIIIKGETHTIGNLITNYIYLADPDVPYVTSTMEHLRDNQITVQLLHPDPKKISLDAINNCIAVFEGLIGQTSPSRKK